ncbi:Putative importin-beta domain, armadillo-like helical, importin beta family [Septoria linicola]|uniref:Importin-beta domain, armadillo-like helical, importin beta family n=1 Tax=Septoria linicola TaxID=215465 RepID=A0A9Q9AJ21_9PEZI|nr:putative importin-beta domain, armadillo-like helical, importin beta family [Septoria linicola]USW49955.1 Putative importin-beta domain, armadillo-like helical, importin beta family [Septoria linicola]
MAWQPEQSPLNQLAQCLRDSLSGHDIQAQKNAEQMLRQAKSSPDINNYLVYLCITPTSNTGLDQAAYHAARSAAAIMLKNNVKTAYKSIPEPSKVYIKANVLQGLQDRNTQIRNYIGNVITEVVRQGGILGWPQVLPDLVAMVANQSGQSSQETQDGAMGALFKICEDNRKALDKEYQTQRPLASLLPELLKFTRDDNVKVRSRALAAINVFLVEPIALTVQENVDQILPEIVRLSRDSNDDVRRFVCRSFALLADSLPEVLVPHVEGVIEYSLIQQQDRHNQELALDAAEFFFESSSNTVLRDALGPYLPRIVPVLLNCIIYSEDDQLRLEGDEEDAELEDEEKDIKPTFAKDKAGRSDASNGAQQNGKPAGNGFAYEDDDLSEGELDEDEDYDDVDPEEEWNLRKCSAASIDSLATHFHGAVFQEVLPWLVENFKHTDWSNREAAVLALGAIGPGCMDNITPHLQELIPLLLNLLNDPQPVVRQITCWSLSRYSSWAAHDPSAREQGLFEPIMAGLLQRMLDHNKKVQQSAASAFASLEEKADAVLAPYCNVILQHFVKCFGKYKDKNMYILYDCVQTLAEHASPTLAEPENVNLLMPALISRWQHVQDQSREMFPLLECLSFVATALGSQFTPFAEPLFTRCIKLIQQNLEDGVSAEQSFMEQPDKDFLVTSLDLLSSIIQALDEQQSARLAGGAQPNMFQLLAYCMRDSSYDVRQSAYALLGDCAIYIFPQLQQYLSEILEILIQQLSLNDVKNDPESMFRVINNACWSCGEISMRQNEGMAPFVEKLLEKLAVIIFSSEVPESLNENAAIALGRLGIGCHDQLAPHLASFAPSFLKYMQKVAWTDEKGHAYKGFVKVVLDNPAALEQCLLDFFSEIANAPDVFLTGMQDDGPRAGFEQVLAKYKQMIGDGFDNYLHNLPPAQESSLRQHYSF